MLTLGRYLDTSWDSAKRGRSSDNGIISRRTADQFAAVGNIQDVACFEGYCNRCIRVNEVPS